MPWSTITTPEPKIEPRVRPSEYTVVGTLPSEGRSHLSRWDDDGSLIAWCFDRVGGPEGQIIPRGVPLAKKVAGAVSNLAVDKGKLGLRR